MSYIPLHLHSHYSMLDGYSSIDEIVEMAVREGMHSIALTDHGVTHGLLEFYNKAKENGVNPILGMEAYFHPVRRGTRELGSNERSRHHHLTILVKNTEGYRNLLRLTSRANTEGFYYVPQIDDEILEEHREGLIVLSGCVSGYIPSLLQRGMYDEAKKQAEKYAMMFGEDFYLELMRHPIEPDVDGKLLSEALVDVTDDQLEEISATIRENQIELTKMLENTEKGLLELHKELGIPLVATNDSHYTCLEDAAPHDIYYAIGQGKKVLDPKRRHFATNLFYIRNEQEMRELFSDIPEAIENTSKIAEKCEVHIEELELTKQGIYQFPKFKVPEGYTTESYIKEWIQDGWDRLIQPLIDAGEADEQEYRERLEFEYNTIKGMGFLDFFLIIADVIRFAESQGIPVGAGRGSAAGSLISYLIGITKIDPLKYGLLFERRMDCAR